MKTKKIITLLLVAVLLISTASLIVACKDKMFEVKVDYNAEQGTVSVSPTSDDGKYKEGTELTVTVTPKTGFDLDTVKLSTDDQAMTPNSDGKFVFTVKEDTTVTVKFKSNSPAPHVCGHVCETCGKCTDATCTDPVCAEKCPGHGTTKQPLASGNYNIVLRDETNNLVWYVTGALNNKGGLTVNHSNATVAVLTVLYENGKYTLKIGEQYLEAYLNNGTYKNMRLVNTPSSDAIEWKWSEEYNTFCAAYSDETRYLGGNYYNGQVDDLYDNAVTLAKEYYFENNPVVIHYEKYVPAPPVEVESVSFNTQKDTLYLLPLEGNYIELTATVQPSNAPQDIVWTVENEDKITFSSGSYVASKFARVTYKDQEATITLTATAKDTDKSASVTIIIQDREGTKQDDALTVDEAIALVADADQIVFADDSNEKKGGFYITGTVATGSKRVGNGWEFSLLGSNEKTLACSVTDAQLETDGITIPLKADGGLDGSEIVFYTVGLRNSAGSYSANALSSKNTIKSLQLPALTAIEIEAASTEVTVPYSVEITVKSITPANAVFENVEWLTSDESKATVSGNESKATVTTIAAGEVKISVRCGSVTSNEITLNLTSEEPKAMKFIYDWTGSLTADSVVDDIYKTTAQENDITDWIKLWSPDLNEIVSFTSAKCRVANDYNTIGGFGYTATTKDGTATITTAHQIKKITLTVVPFSSAKDISFSINGKEQSHPQGDATYTGKLDCSYEVTVELDEATNAIEFLAPKTAGNKFVIVKMILEW